MAKNDSGVVTTKAPKGAPDGTPLQTTRAATADPGPDVSHADVDVAALSLDSAHSSTVPAPEQNPLDLTPAPGPSAVEVLGTPQESDEPANIGGEDGR